MQLNEVCVYEIKCIDEKSLNATTLCTFPAAAKEGKFLSSNTISITPITSWIKNVYYVHSIMYICKIFTYTFDTLARSPLILLAKLKSKYN